MTQRKLRVLVYDVETKPVRAWIWKTGHKLAISHDQIVAGERFDIICICYKWLGEARVHSLDWGLKAQDSSKMIEAFTKIIESADLVIAHNGDSFDLKQINTQRLLHNQPPIAWPTSEDTLKQFRKHFAFPSYKLDYISKLLTGSGKDRMGFQDWIDIVEKKDPAALEKMLRYCRRDVVKLSQIYKRASKYFATKVHAGLATHGLRPSCPRCGSLIAWLNGFKLTNAGRKQRYQCKNCGCQYVGKKT